MKEMFDMLLAVYERAILMLICLFLLTRTRQFRQLLQKEQHTGLELLAVTVIFLCSPFSAPIPVFMWKAH